MEWTNEQSIRVEALNIASREATLRSFGDSRDTAGMRTPNKTIIEIAEEIYQFINKEELEN